MCVWAEESSPNLILREKDKQSSATLLWGSIWVLWKFVYSLPQSAPYTILSSMEHFQEGSGVVVGEYEAYTPGTRLCWLPCVTSPLLFTGTRDKSGRAVAIITTRNTAWLNPHCNTTELVRLLLYLHSIPRFVDALGLTGWALLPCLLCLLGGWKLRQRMEWVDFIGLGTWSRQSWNCTDGDLLLGWTGSYSVNSLALLYVPCVHGMIELGTYWMFSCIAMNPSHSRYPSLAQKMGFGSYDGEVMQQLCDTALWHDILGPDLQAEREGGSSRVEKICLDVWLTIGFGVCRLEFAAATLPLTVTDSSHTHPCPLPSSSQALLRLCFTFRWLN